MSEETTNIEDKEEAAATPEETTKPELKLEDAEQCAEEKEYQIGELACCIGNAQIDLVRLSQDPTYASNMHNNNPWVVSGKIIKAINEELQNEEGKLITRKSYIFEAFTPDGKVMVNPQSGKPMQIELPSESIFPTPHACAEALRPMIVNSARSIDGQITFATKNAMKALEANRKVKLNVVQ